VLRCSQGSSRLKMSGSRNVMWWRGRGRIRWWAISTSILLGSSSGSKISFKLKTSVTGRTSRVQLGTSQECLPCRRLETPSARCSGSLPLNKSKTIWLNAHSSWSNHATRLMNTIKYSKNKSTRTMRIYLRNFQTFSNSKIKRTELSKSRLEV